MSFLGVSCSCFSYCKAFGDAHEAEKKSSSSAQFLFIMKKILLFFVALLCSFGAAVAQVNFVATLQHGGAISHYYGYGALQEAYNAAKDGDIITLSSGTFSFSGREFRKGITVRGTGIDAVDKTYISDVIGFYSSDASMVTNVEGVIFNNAVYVYNDKDENFHGKINFIKNRFKDRFETANRNNPTKTGPMLRIYNCIMNNTYFDEGSNPDFVFYNCYFSTRPGSYLKSTTTSSFVNCILCYYHYGYDDDSRYLNYYNCIFDCTKQNTAWYDPWRVLSALATVQNCLSINCDRFFERIISGGNNQNASSLTTVFKTFSGEYSNGETFELTDEAKKAYIGTDGTQIGMQGGAYPYTSTVQYPVITKFEAAPQTTKEGKLSIDIQVDGK